MRGGTYHRTTNTSLTEKKILLPIRRASNAAGAKWGTNAIHAATDAPV
jgi:hypothetical protein